VFVHPWTSLVLGLALLLIVSGAVLLYEQEIDRVARVRATTRRASHPVRRGHASPWRSSHSFGGPIAEAAGPNRAM